MQRISAQPDDALPSRATIPTAIPSMMLPVVPSVAPGYRAPGVAPGGARIIGVTQQPFVGISLQDAIAMSLLNNPKLAVSASNFRVARYNIVQVKGAYDVALHLEPQSNFSVNPPVNFLDAGPGEVGNYPGGLATAGPGNIIQHQSTTGYGVSGQTENGASYQAGITQSRTYNNTTFNAYNPYYLASLNLAVTQPLLKNAGMNATKRQLKLAFINADADTAQTLIDASTTISQVENTYWDLLAAWRNVAIQEEALREAIAQQQSNVRLVSRGAAAPIDAVESETQVANFQTDVFRALQTVSGLAESAQEPRCLTCRRSNLGGEPRAVDIRRAASERKRSFYRRRRSKSEAAGGSAGAGQAACGRRRRGFCKESVAAASRRAGAVSEQWLRRHPHADSEIYCRLLHGVPR